MNEFQSKRISKQRHPGNLPNSMLNDSILAIEAGLVSVQASHEINIIPNIQPRFCFRIAFSKVVTVLFHIMCQCVLICLPPVMVF